MQPLPPSPAFTLIFASSMNMDKLQPAPFASHNRASCRLQVKQHVFSVYQPVIDAPPVRRLRQGQEAFLLSQL
jgi:hypothetical protein